MPERCLQKVKNFRVGKIVHADDELQLLMRLFVRLPTGEGRVLNALIDTGAQVNLIRTGLLEPRLLQRAKSPVRLVTANNQVLQGGDKTVSLEVTFRQKYAGEFLPNLLACDAEFYQACIDVDAILSFPWLSQYRIGIFPHRKALAIEDPYFAFLYGCKGERSRRKVQKGQRCVEVVSQQVCHHTAEPVETPTAHTPILQDDCLDKLWKTHFSLPPQDLDWDGKPLSRSEKRLLARVLRQFEEPKSVRPIIQSHDESEEVDPRIA